MTKKTMLSLAINLVEGMGAEHEIVECSDLGYDVLRITSTEETSEVEILKLIDGFWVREAELHKALGMGEECTNCSIDGLDSAPKADPIRDGLDAAVEACHAASYAAGWWHHVGTGLPYIPGDDGRVIGENGEIQIVPWDAIDLGRRELITHYWPMFVATKIALIASETFESFEAWRKDMMDDKLPRRTGIETETADALIRQFDLAGALNRAARLGVVDVQTHVMDLPEAFREKMGFNTTRPDHKPTTRAKTGGKKF